MLLKFDSNNKCPLPKFYSAYYILINNQKYFRYELFIFACEHLIKHGNSDLHTR